MLNSNTASSLVLSFDRQTHPRGITGTAPLRLRTHHDATNIQSVLSSFPKTMKSKQLLSKARAIIDIGRGGFSKTKGQKIEEGEG